MLSATEAREAGFVAAIVEDPKLDGHLGKLTERLRRHAPITSAPARKKVRRTITVGPTEDKDSVHQYCGSSDFQEGKRAFVEKQCPVWTG
jgi:enoyl-CoA hydratase/carnithine racemase